MKNMRLKLARVEMNLSQEELAAKVNVTRHYQLTRRRKV